MDAIAVSCTRLRKSNGHHAAPCVAAPSQVVGTHRVPNAALLIWLLKKKSIWTTGCWDPTRARPHSMTCCSGRGMSTPSDKVAHVVCNPCTDAQYLQLNGIRGSRYLTRNEHLLAVHHLVPTRGIDRDGVTYLVCLFGDVADKLQSVHAGLRSGSSRFSTGQACAHYSHAAFTYWCGWVSSHARPPLS
jgi:hypothetical protein